MCMLPLYLYVNKKSDDPMMIHRVHPVPGLVLVKKSEYNVVEDIVIENLYHVPVMLLIIIISSSSRFFY